MAFPSFAATNTGTNDTTGTSHSANLPSGISSGDLLLVFIANDGSATIGGTLSTEYTNILNTANGSIVRGSIWAKTATGSEGSTVAFTTSASESCCVYTARIGANYWRGGTITSAVEIASSTGGAVSPNPGSLNPTNWDVEDTLWVAGFMIDGNRSATGYPSNYTGNQSSQTVSTATSGCGLTLCTRQYAAASDDPGAFTVGTNDDHVLFTLAIRPNQYGYGAFTQADSVSTAGTLEGASTAAVAFTAATGASAAGTLAGEDSTPPARDVPLKFSRLTSSRHAGRKAGTFFGRMDPSAFVSADGLATTSSLGGASTAAGDFVSASGAATASEMLGSDSSGGIVVGAFVSADGLGTAGTLEGGSTAAADLVAAAGASTAGDLATEDMTKSGDFVAASGVATASSMAGENAASESRSVARFSRLTSSRHAGRKAGTFAGRIFATAFTSAAGASVVSSMAGTSTGGGAFVPAAGVSTAGTLAAVDNASARSLGRIVKGTGVGWGTQTGTPFARINVIAFEVAAATSTASAMAGSSTAGATMTAAAGISAAGSLQGASNWAVGFVQADGVAVTGMAGASVWATSFVQADGVSAAGDLAAGGITAATAADGVSTAETMAGAAVAATSFVQADGASVAGSLFANDSTSAIQLGGFAAAAGVSTAETLAGSADASPSFVPAYAAAVPSVMEGAATAAVAFGFADGVGTAEIMAGADAGGIVVAGGFVASVGEALGLTLPTSSIRAGGTVIGIGVSTTGTLSGTSTGASTFAPSAGSSVCASMQSVDVADSFVLGDFVSASGYSSTGTLVGISKDAFVSIGGSRRRINGAAQVDRFKRIGPALLRKPLNRIGSNAP